MNEEGEIGGVYHRKRDDARPGGRGNCRLMGRGQKAKNSSVGEGNVLREEGRSLRKQSTEKEGRTFWT